MRSCRIMALDYGTKNVGLACCDELGIVVRPLPSIPNHSFRDFLGRLRPALREHETEAILIGVPLNMNGTRGRLVEQVEQFISRLTAVLDLPLKRIDERLSTIEALELWNRMNRRQQRKYRTVDSLAAAIILERYLKEG